MATGRQHKRVKKLQKVWKTYNERESDSKKIQLNLMSWNQVFDMLKQMFPDRTDKR